MKVLVTGTPGFIGSHSAMRMLERGDKATGFGNLSNYDDVNLRQARSALFKDHPNSAGSDADPTNQVAVESAFETHKPRRVITLAAQARVRNAAENPHVNVSNSVTGSHLHILEFTRT